MLKSIGVWIAAALISLLASASWVGLNHMDDATPLNGAAFLREALPVLGIVALCQLGLVLAPLARAWRWQYRLLVGLLMVPTLFVTLTVGYQQLAEAAFWGSLAFRRVDSLWIPVLVLYIAQLGGLVRGTRTSRQSRAEGLTVADADEADHDSSAATSSSS